MKNIILILGVILLVANILLGNILSRYTDFNTQVNCGVIIATTFLLYVLNFLKSYQMKDSLYFFLTILICIGAIACLILGYRSPQRLEDNWYLIAIIIIMAIEGIILTAITGKYAKKINSRHMRKGKRSLW